MIGVIPFLRARIETLNLDIASKYREKHAIVKRLVKALARLEEGDSFTVTRYAGGGQGRKKEDGIVVRGHIFKVLKICPTGQGQDDVRKISYFITAKRILKNGGLSQRVYIFTEEDNPRKAETNHE